MKRLIILDFDGVIADSEHAYDQAYRKVIAHFGKPVPYTDFSAWYDSSWEKNILRAGFAESEISAVVSAFPKFMSYEEVRPFPGMSGQLAALAALAALVVCSTTRRPLVAPFLEQHALLSFFEEVYSSPTASSKEALFREAIEKSGAALEHTIVIGDTAADIEPARRLGCLTIGAAYGWYGPARIRSAGPTMVVEDPGGLVAAVKELLGDPL